MLDINISIIIIISLILTLIIYRTTNFGMPKNFKNVKTGEKSGSHGSHFKIAIGETTYKQFSELMHYITFKGKREPFKYFDSFNYKVNKYLAIKEILPKFKDGRITNELIKKYLITAYPVNVKSESHQVKIENIELWKHYEGFESWIKASFESGANVYFFPTDFYANRYKYFSKDKLEINFSAFAYSVFKAPEGEMKDKEGRVLTYGKGSALMPLWFSHKEAYLDDNIVQGTVKKIINLKKAKLILLEVNLSESCLNLWIYATNRTIKTKIIRVNEYLACNAWIQGSIKEQ